MKRRRNNKRTKAIERRAALIDGIVNERDNVVPLQRRQR
jgi:hypothetical protein